MSRFLLATLVLLSAAFASPVEAVITEKVVLHFDINKTLTANNRMKGKTLENVVNLLLAKKYTAIWKEGQESPMSYYDYVRNVLVTGDGDAPKIKKKRRKYLSRFVSFLEETDHPLKDTVQAEYAAMLEKVQASGSKVFTSFYTLLDYLNENQIPHSVVLRSFGNNPDAVEEIDHYYDFPFFEGHASFKKGELLTEDTVLTNSIDIYNYLNSGKNLVIRDDWSWWIAHKRHHTYGKPFYVDLKHPEVVHIFFDDRIECPCSGRNVVNPIDVHTGTTYSIKRLMRKGKIVKVDTIDAIYDDFYFIKKVMNAIQIPWTAAATEVQPEE